MQRLEVSGAVRPIYGSLGVKRLNSHVKKARHATYVNVILRRIRVTIVAVQKEQVLHIILSMCL
jgi:hypothetical protein